MKNEERLRNIRVVDWLPNIFGRNESIPEGLVGATIIRVGTLSDSHLVEGGGLVIDYRPARCERTFRIIIACDETAMWLVARYETSPESE